MPAEQGGFWCVAVGTRAAFDPCRWSPAGECMCRRTGENTNNRFLSSQTANSFFMRADPKPGKDVGDDQGTRRPNSRASRANNASRSSSRCPPGTASSCFMHRQAVLTTHSRRPQSRASQASPHERYLGEVRYFATTNGCCLELIPDGMAGCQSHESLECNRGRPKLFTRAVITNLRYQIPPGWLKIDLGTGT